MQWLKKQLSAMMRGQGGDLGAGTFEMLFVSNSHVPDDTDATGDEFEADLGANILHRETVAVALADRTLDLTPFQMQDPGGGSVVGHVYLMHRAGASNPSTNRLVAHEDIQDLTLDGAADQINDSAEGLLSLEQAP